MMTYSLLEPLRQRLGRLARVHVSKLAFLLVGLRCSKCGRIFRSLYDELVDANWHVAEEDGALIKKYQARGLAPPPWAYREPFDTPERRARELIVKHGHHQPLISRHLF